MTRQKVFPLPTVGAPSASNSPSALSAQALDKLYIQKQVKGQNYWHFGRNILILLAKNALFEKVPKYLGRGPPPSFGQRKHFFSQENIPID